MQASRKQLVSILSLSAVNPRFSKYSIGCRIQITWKMCCYRDVIKKSQNLRFVPLFFANFTIMFPLIRVVLTAGSFAAMFGNNLCLCFKSGGQDSNNKIFARAKCQIGITQCWITSKALIQVAIYKFVILIISPFFSSVPRVCTYYCWYCGPIFVIFCTNCLVLIVSRLSKEFFLQKWFLSQNRLMGGCTLSGGNGGKRDRSGSFIDSPLSESLSATIICSFTPHTEPHTMKPITNNSPHIPSCIPWYQ